MDKNEKNMKRSIISKAIDISKAHLKDSEVDMLYQIAIQPEKYDGTKKTHKIYRSDFDHDGSYEREIADSYTLRASQDRIGIDLHSETYDDGGLSSSGDRFFNTARDVLNILRDHFW